MDVLSVLIARAAGRPVSSLLEERVFGPLGMTDTAYWARDASRLTTAYVAGAGGLEVFEAADGDYGAPPPFEELASGLVSTAGDVLRFFAGVSDLLSAESVRRMTTAALSGRQRAMARAVLGERMSWGLGTGVEPEGGRWGWDGGTGTSARVDPARGTVAVLLTQRALTGPLDGFDAFHDAVAVGETPVKSEADGPRSGVCPPPIPTGPSRPRRAGRSSAGGSAPPRS
jgi:CubicO group peptidase (beta-lactamase class C family)